MFREDFAIASSVRFAADGEAATALSLCPGYHDWLSEVFIIVDGVVCSIESRHGPVSGDEVERPGALWLLHHHHLHHAGCRDGEM